MNRLKVEQLVVGAVMTNCYIAVNTETKEGFVVDPGDGAKRLGDYIKDNGIQLQAILLTHGHFDHAGAAEELAKEFGVSIYAHQEEKETLNNPSINLSGMVGAHVPYEADKYVTEQTVIDVCGFSIEVFHTPGHTKGGCCYYMKEEKALFSGDTLFCNSIGRTDFPGGSGATLLRSIEEKLFILPEDVTVYPGHNDITTIGWEKKHNPFI